MRTAIRTETGLHLPIDALDPSSKIPPVMHVRLRGLAIQAWCYHGFCTKSARQGGNLDRLARLLKKQTGHRRLTRDVQVPTSSTVLFVKKLLTTMLGEILLCVRCMCLLISFSFRDGFIVAMPPPFLLQC